MCGPYWSQWDKADLDSWQGKDLVEENCDDCDLDLDEDERGGEEDGCPCGYYCLDCLGMSWRDFM